MAIGTISAVGSAYAFVTIPSTKELSDACDDALSRGLPVGTETFFLNSSEFGINIGTESFGGPYCTVLGRGHESNFSKFLDNFFVQTQMALSSRQKQNPTHDEFISYATFPNGRPFYIKVWKVHPRRQSIFSFK